jgi:hypothetical protein
MSLAGNLSDLSLPELLQVVALSRKTGALEICSEQGGVAWLGLRDGGIVRVALEDGDLDRELILKRAGMGEEPDSDVAEATLWDAAVQAILRIFEWTEGDFTFQPLDDPALQWRGPKGILLPSPLSPEFLALEGARLEDENASLAASARAREAIAVAEEFATPVGSPPEADEREPESEPPTQAEAVPSPIAEEYESTFTQRTPLVVAAPPAPAVAREPEPEPEPTPAPAPSSQRPDVLICVDADLAILELLKRGLHSDTTRIHIFQSATDALQRFKQYVVRGETPALILGSMVEDPLDAHQGLGWRRFAGRILGIAPRLRLVVVARSGEQVAAPGMAVVKRPDPKIASELDYQAFVVEIGRALDASA